PIDSNWVVCGESCGAALSGILSQWLVVTIGGDEHLSVGDHRGIKFGKKPQTVALCILFARPQRPAHVVRVKCEDNSLHATLLIGVTIERNHRPHNPTARLAAIGGYCEHPARHPNRRTKLALLRTIHVLQ